MTTDQELGITAARLIDASRYLVLATADQDGVPWASPVWFAHAGYREFFWISDPGARHSRNIGGRPRVSMVIFDSGGPPGAPQAVYISGTASVVTGPDLEESIAVYSRRSQEQGLPAWAPGSVRAPAQERLYRAVAGEQFALRPGGIDERIPVVIGSAQGRVPNAGLPGLAGKVA